MGLGTTQNTSHEAGNLHFISVAIDSYGLPFMQDLSACNKDAASIVEKIKMDSSGDEFRIRGERHFYLHGDEEATLDKIHESFEKVLGESRPDDLLVIFLAGRSQKTGGFSLFTHPGNLEWKGVDEAAEYALSLEKLQSWISQVECRQQLIILDLCAEEGMQEDLISGLTVEDPKITKLTNRNRVIVSTEGGAIEDGEGGILTQILTGIDGNLFYLLDPKLRKSIEFEMLSVQQSLCANWPDIKWCYSQVFYEKDYAHIAASFEKTRAITGAKKIERSAGKARTGPQDYALVVGINEYDAKSTWLDLENPLRDGAKVAEILEGEYGYETQFLKNATQDDLYNAIYHYSELQDKQNLILFFAGHGYFDDQLHDDGFIVLKDSKSLDQDRGLRSYFQFVTLQKIVDNFNFKHILLVTDVCFGGTFGYNARISYSYTPEQRERLDKLTKTESTRRTYDAVDRKYFLDRQLMFKSRYFIASGIGEVREGEGLHSPFARNFLDALESKGNRSIQVDDLLTFDELKAYCGKNVNMPIHGNFGSHQGGDFILIPSKVKKELLES